MKMAIFIADKARQESGTGLVAGGRTRQQAEGGKGTVVGGSPGITPGILNIYANWQPGA